MVPKERAGCGICYPIASLCELALGQIRMIQLPSEPKLVSKEGNKGVFEIGPLYPGYGTTIGNSLRRVLLSSLEGAAITSIKIRGVDHEFSNIPGVLEDVIDIILNLKKVRFKLFKEEPETVTLSVKGQKEITAADIKTTADIEVVNPDQLVATITDKKTELEMEITVERGVGYLPVEQRQKEKISIGKIAIDGIFTPIKTVNFNVENIRVGQRTDYNKVLLDIETDGSISPEAAIKNASQILIDHFNIVNAIEIPKETVAAKKSKRASKKKE